MLSKEVNDSEIRCAVERLKERLPIILENPIIKEFLKDSDHREVFSAMKSIFQSFSSK